MFILTASRLKTAQQEIADSDAVMADLIARLPAAKLVRKQSPFHVLATSIINQQLSQKAAAAIENRIATLAPAPFNAVDITQLPKEQLRQAGLSHRKIEYLHALAQAEINGVLDEKQLNRLSDNEVVSQLTAIHGIGKWTAEMFLMFCLRRSNVLSLGDAGLLRAARMLYGKRLRGDDGEVLEKAAKKWHPWRTVGCYYLWRSLDKK
ncbi:MAG: DNA-3-methyladenine glycosylase 2 family protein [Proteobacteria bacterium]|nr:DNA-3-methyladenine glycosylase 2 family protein [Pseudomonadota bacterium]